MGYSVYIRVRDDSKRKKFLQFMQTNFRHWKEVSGQQGTEWHGSASDPTDDLYEGKTAIGFHYQSGMFGFERDYIYSMIRWMAIVVGDHRSGLFSGGLNLKGDFLFYGYDAEDLPSVVIVVDTKKDVEALPKEMRQWAVDKFGIRLSEDASVSMLSSCLSNSIFDPKEGLRIELEALGPNAEGDHDRWWAQFHEICLRHLKPEIDKNVELIREEIQRLDRLWFSKA